MRHAIIATVSGLVVNTVAYDDDISGTTPPGMEQDMLAQASDIAQIGWSWAGGRLSPPDRLASLDEVKISRVALLTAACQAAIVGGFSSDALGEVHTYPSGTTDQINMLGRVAQAQLDPTAVLAYWCADAAGVWAKRPHTAAQMIQVGQDGAAWVQTNSDRLSGPDGTGGLIEQVQVAGSIAEVNAAVW